MFVRDPAKYAPQYGGFCASGAAYAVKLGSDPTEFRIVDGRLFIFGDVLGREYWLMDPKWHIEKADLMWPEAGAFGHRYQSLKRFVFKVPWYKTGKEVHDEWQAAHPGQTINYDPGGVFTNLFIKYPGWRAREGYGQPAAGLVGVDPCPPACVGAVSKGGGARGPRGGGGFFYLPLPPVPTLRPKKTPHFPHVNMWFAAGSTRSDRWRQPEFP